MTHPILVTAPRAGLGALGGLVVGPLRRRGLPVCAFVRRGHERVEALRATGALVIVAKT